MDWKKIWRKTYRTMAQALIAVIPSAGVFWSWDWKPMLSTVVISGLVCFLSAIVDSDNAYIEAEEYEDNPEDDEIVNDESLEAEG